MKNENELHFFIQEKEEVIKQYNQSKILIEKLEEELRNVKELSNTGDKNVYNILYKEYAEIINMLCEKIKTVQEKYRDEVCKSSKKEYEIKYLNEKINEMSTKLSRVEEECGHLSDLLKQEHEKYIQIKKQLITAENKLSSTERKYQCLNILEEERDKLQLENCKLSRDCKELEGALGACHKTIQSYEEKLCQVTTCVDSILKEKDIIAKKEIIADREEIVKLKEVIRIMKTEYQKVKEELNAIQENCDDDIEQLVLKFSLDSILMEEDRKEIKADDFNLKDFSKTRGSIFKLYKLLKNFKETLQKNLNEKQKLQVKIDIYQWDSEKRKNQVAEMNSVISNLKRKFLIIQKQLRSARKNPNMRKYIRNVEVANFELLKQIKSQENLHDKWKKYINEIIQKFQSRIVELNKNYQKLEKENTRIKNHLESF